MRWVALLGLVIGGLIIGWYTLPAAGSGRMSTSVALPAPDAPPSHRPTFLPRPVQSAGIVAPTAGEPLEVKRGPRPLRVAHQLLMTPVAHRPPRRRVVTPPFPPIPLLPPAAPPSPLTPLQLGTTRFSLFTINPQFTAQQVAFTVSTPARVTIQIKRQEQTRPVRTLDLSIQPAGALYASWNGRDDEGRPVPGGVYDYQITATDGAGARVSESAAGLAVTYKRMVISLAGQRLTAYDGSTMVLSTLVTTGNVALPTPVGIFPILARYHPFTFTSPWPTTSPYYYPPSPVNYALLFDDRGYFIHDAPWRSVFGPGSNAAVGTPGQNYTGTHGCVNVPVSAAQFLFDWATIGTIVQVTP